MEELENLDNKESVSTPPYGGVLHSRDSCQCKVPDFEQRLKAILAAFSPDKGNLIAILQGVQAGFSYLPRESLTTIASHIHVPTSKVYSIATFYNQFRFTPLGKHPVKVCMGTACHMAGGQLVLEAMGRDLEIKVGGITPDGRYSLERVACVGCCAIAPVVLVGETVHRHMSPFKVEEVMTLHKAENREKGGEGLREGELP